MTKIFKGIGYLIGAVINGVWEVTKYGTFLGSGLAVSGVALALFTKPEEKSFHDFFDNFIKKNNIYKTNTGLDAIIDTVSTLSAKAISSKTFADWGLCRVATVKYATGEEIQFIGTLKGWHNQETIKQLFKRSSD